MYVGIINSDKKLLLGIHKENNSQLDYYLNGEKLTDNESFIELGRNDSFAFYFILANINFSSLERDDSYIEIINPINGRIRLFVIPLKKYPGKYEKNYYLCLYLISEKSKIDITKLIFNIL